MSYSSNRWIAFIRGINVGGHNKVPMASLKKALEAAGCRAVQTYIQSGNVIFHSASKSKRTVAGLLGDAIEGEFGFRPNSVLLTAAEFRQAVANNPYAEIVTEPKSLHFFIMSEAPEAPDLAGIAKLAATTERYELVGTVFYLLAPDGIGRSKLAAGAERKLGQSATARNFATIMNLSKMLDAESSS